MANQNGVGLPVLSPIAMHGLPFGVGSLNVDGLHIAFATHVVNQDEIEVLIPIDSESDAAFLLAWYPGGHTRN